jgi:hypothetical protein
VLRTGRDEKEVDEFRLLWRDRMGGMQRYTAMRRHG